MQYDSHDNIMIDICCKTYFKLSILFHTCPVRCFVRFNVTIIPIGSSFSDISSPMPFQNFKILTKCDLIKVRNNLNVDFDFHNFVYLIRLLLTSVETSCGSRDMLIIDQFSVFSENA